MDELLARDSSELDLTDELVRLVDAYNKALGDKARHGCWAVPNYFCCAVLYLQVAPQHECLMLGLYMHACPCIYMYASCTYNCRLPPLILTVAALTGRAWSCVDLSSPYHTAV